MSKLKELFKWIGADGLLHFLVCYAMMLTLPSFIGIVWSTLATTSVAILKEVYDFCIQKDNDEKAVMHDLIMDASGIVLALVIIAVS
jgi:hypothetical protein